MKKILLTVSVIVLVLIIICFVMLLFTEEPQQADYYQLPSNPPSSDTLLTKQEAIEDSLFFKDALENNHPALYRFISKDALDEKFMQFQALLEKQKEISVGLLYFTLKEITGAIDDIHTNVYAPVYPDEKIIPLKVQLIDEKLFVTQAIPPGSIPVGSQIISINASPVQDIIKKMSIYSNTPLQTGTNVFVQDYLMRLFPRLMNTQDSCVVEYSFDGNLEKSEIPLIIPKENEKINNSNEQI